MAQMTKKDMIVEISLMLMDLPDDAVEQILFELQTPEDQVIFVPDNTLH